MSLTFVGGVSAIWSAPFVYFIRSGECLYVGETQRHPVVRWSQHLGPQGSFRLAAEGRAEIVLDGATPIAFYAFEVAPLRSLFPEVQLKAATQAVEHEIHMLLRARPSFLGPALRVISDTEKTAPRTFRRWDIAQALAEEAAAALRAAWAKIS